MSPVARASSVVVIIVDSHAALNTLGVLESGFDNENVAVTVGLETPPFF